MISSTFNHRDKSFVADPYPTLRALREEGPVLWSPQLKAWLIVRHAQFRAALRDTRLSSDRMRPFLAQVSEELREVVEPLCRGLMRWQVFNDPPRHQALRALIGRAFSPPAVESMRKRLVIPGPYPHAL